MLSVSTVKFNCNQVTNNSSAPCGRLSTKNFCLFAFFLHFAFLYDSVNANYVDLFELTLGLGRLTHALMNHLVKPVTPQ